MDRFSFVTFEGESDLNLKPTSTGERLYYGRNDVTVETDTRWTEIKFK